MVVVMKSTATQEDIEGVKKEMETYGLNMMVSHGDDYTILGAEGNAAAVDQEKISLLSGVERVMRVSEPYKMANRKYHPQNTQIDVGGVKIGGKRLESLPAPAAWRARNRLRASLEQLRLPVPALCGAGPINPARPRMLFRDLSRTASNFWSTPVQPPASNVSLYGDVSSVGFYMLGVRGCQP